MKQRRYCTSRTSRQEVLELPSAHTPPIAYGKTLECCLTGSSVLLLITSLFMIKHWPVQRLNDFVG